MVLWNDVVAVAVVVIIVVVVLADVAIVVIVLLLSLLCGTTKILKLLILSYLYGIYVRIAIVTACSSGLFLAMAAVRCGGDRIFLIVLTIVLEAFNIHNHYYHGDSFCWFLRVPGG